MNLHPIFKLRERATEEIIQLLESVTLGTDGAHYRHLDTRERIQEADNPLFLSMERHEKVLGNVTFCRRNDIWYIRYFAFNESMQSTGRKKSKAKGGLLRTELNRFFNQALQAELEEPVNAFYAYIDPRNAKSLWMSESFGFETIGKIATQTFSRTRPKKSSRVQKMNDWNEIADLVNSNFSDQLFYFDAQSKKPPFYVLRDDNGTVLASAKINISDWAIDRLPGKFGGTLIKILPYIPVIRRLIQPKYHSFVVPEAVYVKDQNPIHLTELFEGILASENRKVAMWWVDEKEPSYIEMKSTVKWGPLNRILGVNQVNVVVKSNQSFDDSKVIYTSGFDFI